jgi:hypothetical protein
VGGELLYLAVRFGGGGENGAVRTGMGEGEGVVGKIKGGYGAGRTKTPP